MISRITIENFKSYRHAELPLGPLTLLIGTNASGKSNAIEAMRFLSLLADGRWLDDLAVSVQREDVAIRGTVMELSRNGGVWFALGCTMGGQDVSPWNDFRIEIDTELEVRVVQESISAAGEPVPLYQVKEPASAFSHELRVAYNNFARGGIKPIIPCSDQQAVFTQLDTPARFTSKMAQRVIPRTVMRYREALLDILFLDPSPRRMREYSFIADDQLAGDGRNLSSVLYRLEKEGQLPAVLEFVRALPEQEVRRLGFIETPRREVMLFVTEAFGDEERQRDAPVLSDGTLRVLAMAAALLSAPAGSLVVIEEIDNGIHPSRAERLLAVIRRVATERNLRVLLTSHNPALLDSLPDEAVPDVVACYRDPGDGTSRLVRLEDLDEYPELVARGPLGLLMTEGVLERTLHRRKTAAERQVENEAWLREMQSQG